MPLCKTPVSKIIQIFQKLINNYLTTLIPPLYPCFSQSCFSLRYQGHLLEIPYYFTSFLFNFMPYIIQ